METNKEVSEEVKVKSLQEIIDLVDAYWKFDNDQRHTHTWHDKQDLLEKLRQFKSETTSLRELLVANQNYVKFLSEYCGSIGPYLFVHGMGPPDEQVVEGERLRSIIKEKESALQSSQGGIES